MFNELIDGVKADMVDEVVLCTTSFGLGVNATMVVPAISTGGGGEKEITRIPPLTRTRHSHERQRVVSSKSCTFSDKECAILSAVVGQQSLSVYSPIGQFTVKPLLLVVHLSRGNLEAFA